MDEPSPNKRLGWRALAILIAVAVVLAVGVKC
jgi:hypothetical protein